MVRIKDKIMSYKYSGNLQAERRKYRKMPFPQFRQSSDVLCCGVPLKLLESLPHLEYYQELVCAVGPWLWACKVGFLGPLPLRGPIRYLGVARDQNTKKNDVKNNCS